MTHSSVVVVWQTGASCSLGFGFGSVGFVYAHTREARARAGLTHREESSSGSDALIVCLLLVGFIATALLFRWGSVAVTPNEKGASVMKPVHEMTLEEIHEEMREGGARFDELKDRMNSIFDENDLIPDLTQDEAEALADAHLEF